MEAFGITNGEARWSTLDRYFGERPNLSGLGGEVSCTPGSNIVGSRLRPTPSDLRPISNLTRLGIHFGGVTRTSDTFISAEQMPRG
jgi:hypothetical protein